MKLVKIKSNQKITKMVQMAVSALVTRLSRRTNHRRVSHSLPDWTVLSGPKSDAHNAVN